MPQNLIEAIIDLLGSRKRDPCVRWSKRQIMVLNAVTLDMTAVMAPKIVGELLCVREPISRTGSFAIRASNLNKRLTLTDVLPPRSLGVCNA